MTGRIEGVWGRRLLRVGAVLGCAAAVLALPLSWAQDPAAGGQRKVFTNSVVPLPVESGPTPSGFVVHAAKPANKTEKLDVLFSLPLSPEAQAKLEERVAKGEVLKPDELEREFRAKQDDVDKVVKWLKAEGYQVQKVSPDGTSIYARANVGQIEKSLQVQFVRVTRDGLTYNAARNAPSLPNEVGAGVQAIMGLQPFRQAHKQSRMRRPHEGNRAAADDPDAGGPTAAPNIANAPPYLVSEILKAYNAEGLGVTGAGQKIAILIDTFPSANDLKSFWKKNGLSVTTKNVERINVNGVTLPHREGEETLDVEWASGIAPGATIRVYASGSLSFVDLDRALDRIIEDLPSEPGMRQLSISLGLGETFLMTPGGPPLSGEVAIQHQKFLKLAAAGVNVFVSSGDAGSNPDATGHNPTGPLQAEYESSDPFVVGVGGTKLILDPMSGDVTSEEAWTDSGGGESSIFPRPAFQLVSGLPAGSQRLVPDVCLAADPELGAMVVFQGQVQQIGGTSWSAPVWAGFCALMNEARTKAGKPALPFLNPLIYPLIGSGCFRDIKSGSNGAFSAGDGFDRVTGIGSPNVKALIDKLAK